MGAGSNCQAWRLVGGVGKGAERLVRPSTRGPRVAATQDDVESRGGREIAAEAFLRPSAHDAKGRYSG